MPQRFDNLLTVLFAAVVLAGLVLYLRPDPQSAMATPMRAVEMVAQAQEVIGQNSIIPALKTLDTHPDFNSGGVHLFVLDADGSNLFHAADRTRIGTDFALLTDLDGRPYGRQMIRDTDRAGVRHSYRLRTGWQLTYARATPRGHIIAAGFTSPH